MTSLYSSPRSRLGSYGPVVSPSSASGYRRRDSSAGSSYHAPAYSSGSAASSPVVMRRHRPSSASGAAGSRRSVAPTSSGRYGGGGISGSRNSVFVNAADLGAETAKYNRETAIREIRDDFVRKFEEDQRKYWPAREEESGGGGGLGRARQGLIMQGSGSAGSAAAMPGLDDSFARREVISDMFMNTKFSTRTVATISNLNDAGLNKRKEDYKWRKDLEEFENSETFKRESMIRSIESRSRKRKEREEKMDQWKPPIPVPAKSKREKIRQGNNKNAEQQAPLRAVENVSEPPQPAPRVSWRERMAARENETKKEQQHYQDVKANDAPAPAAPAIKSEVKRRTARTNKKVAFEEEEEEKKTSNQAAEDKVASSLPPLPSEEKADVAGPAGDKKEDKKDDDENGTKKLKSDLDAMMENMEREMEAGRGKLARLRERIRKAKGVIKETDQALANAPKG